MDFAPTTRNRLLDELAGWVVGLPAAHATFGIDGFAEVGATELADELARRVRALGRPAVRASTRWWWRSASLRLELGRTDVDMLLFGWVDAASLRRELLDPFGPGGSGSYLRRLRDPATDRAVRESRQHIDDGAVLLLDGPFLHAAAPSLDAMVYLDVASGTVLRALPVEKQWWVGAFERYLGEVAPAERAEVIVSYDHPASPAIHWR